MGDPKKWALLGLVVFIVLFIVLIRQLRLFHYQKKEPEVDEVHDENSKKAASKINETHFSRRKTNTIAKVVYFIITIVVLTLLNSAIMIYESKAGLRFPKSLTFVLPIIVAYFVIFRKNKKEKSNKGISNE